MRGIIGADIFINLLLVFIITTGLLFMNTNKGAKTKIPASSERTMPRTMLPEASANGPLAGPTRNSATLTARKENGTIYYFLNRNPISISTLTNELKSKRIETLKIRFDERIPYGDYIKILELSTAGGVLDIFNVYSAKSKN